MISSILTGIALAGLCLFALGAAYLCNCRTRVERYDTHEDDSKRINRAIRRAARTGRSVIVKARETHEDGE